MALFKDMLKADESLFRNEIALDYSFMPKLAPYRESQQRYIAACIKPLFQKRNGKNLFIYGKPGIGKTLICKKVLDAIEEETDEEILPIYINCWKTNTSFKIMNEICKAIDYKFTQNKRTEELFEIIKQILNKKSVVFCFDEIDKVEDLDFAYSILEDIYLPFRPKRRCGTTVMSRSSSTPPSPTSATRASRCASASAGCPSGSSWTIRLSQRDWMKHPWT